MTEIKLCKNCNASRVPLHDVVVTVDENSEAQERIRYTLCEPCIEAFGALDFKEFVKRHENRPRTLELP